MHALCHHYSKLNRLEAVYRRMLKPILGVGMMTCSEFLYIELGVLPIKIQVTLKQPRRRSTFVFTRAHNLGSWLNKFQRYPPPSHYTFVFKRAQNLGSWLNKFQRYPPPSHYTFVFTRAQNLGSWLNKFQRYPPPPPPPSLPLHVRLYESSKPWFMVE